jgi:putative hydrolases of HD superfamily
VDAREDASPEVPWPAGRLGQQLRFLVEVDRLKGVQRMTRLADGSRLENAAEHSWHLTLIALFLAEHAACPVDLGRVWGMLAVHDLVEIDAGDTFLYDQKGRGTKGAREQAAADRIFGLLPADQAASLHELWSEFDAGQTAEARFANGVDRLAPVLLNFLNRCEIHRQHGIPAARVLAENSIIGEAVPALKDFVKELMAAAVERGWLEND